MSKSTLYIITGLPYAGKTMLRNALVKRFGFGAVSVDEIIAERRHTIERMSPAEWNSAYQEAYNRLEKLIANGKTAIFDACNLYRHERDGARRVAENARADCKLIYVDTPPAEVRNKWLLNQETKERSSLGKEFFYMTMRIFEKPAPEENPITYRPPKNVDNWIKKNIGDPPRQDMGRGGESLHDQDIRAFIDRHNKFYPFYHPQKFFVREMIIKKILEKNPRLDLSIKNKIVKGLISLYGKSFNMKYGENNFLTNWFDDFIATTEGRRLEKIYLRNKKEIKKLSILDAGCGPGNYFGGFLKDGLRYFIDYTGTDIAEKNLAASRQLYPNTRFLCGDITKLPFPPDSFDIVLASRVLEYIPLGNLNEALEELLRVAKKTLIINFLLQKDIPDHVEIKLPLYFRNALSRIKLKRFFMDRNCAVSITDAYWSFGDKKIEYMNRFGKSIALSSWVIEKSAEL